MGDYLMNRLLLAIDTSSDETSVAVTSEHKVIANIIWSQASQHSQFGGIYPSLAKRLHTERIDWVINQALRVSRLEIKKFQAIAVTVGPGLAPALEIGIAKAKEIAVKNKLPLIPVNHLEGHVLSPLAIPKTRSSHPASIKYPIAGLVISGGHTQLVLIEEIGKYKILAHTLDDALGEALDKAARMLGLGYTGAAVLEKMAARGNLLAYNLPLPLLGRENRGEFSFSGLKSAFYRLVSKQKLNRQNIYDLAASFQNRAFEHLLRIIRFQLCHQNINLLLAGGGVSSNITVRKHLRKLGKELNFQMKFPYSQKLCTDNAAMIGLAALWAWNRGEAAKTKEEIMKIDRDPNLNFSHSRIRVHS